MKSFCLRSFASLVVASAFALNGCASKMSSSTSNEPASVSTGASNMSAPAPSNAYHHGRHHRHRHHAGGAYAAGGAAVAGGAVAAAAHPAPAGSGAYPCNDAQFLSDQSQFASGSLQGDQEVDVCGTVTKVLAEKDTRSGLHGYYDIQVAPGSQIEIVSDLGEMNAPAWPWVKVGDYSTVRGRYYYDSASSQGVDWTHHGTSRSWPSAGYVVVAGTLYQ